MIYLKKQRIFNGYDMKKFFLRILLKLQDRVEVPNRLGKKAALKVIADTLL
jgi:hypothetical protein